MAISPIDAAQAFSKAAKLGSGGMEPRAMPGQSSFVDLLKDVATKSIEAGKESERLTAAAVAGEADLTDVVTAVSNAEMTLQTVVTVRDRVLAAYQEILRMPV
jgi:flagellar hook-basal body complex protein FliE